MTEDVVTIDLAGGAQLTVQKRELVRAYFERSLSQEISERAIALEAVIGLSSLQHAPPRIGEDWPGQGGKNCGVMRGETGRPDYYLIAPPDALIKEMTWGGAGKEEPGALSEWDGLENTRALVKSKTDHPAAEWASKLEIGGKGQKIWLRDLYLPARRELQLMWANVPELFEETWHWSSTQSGSDADYAWVQTPNGDQGYDHKGDKYRARAVRRLIIQ